MRVGFFPFSGSLDESPRTRNFLALARGLVASGGTASLFAEAGTTSRELSLPRFDLRAALDSPPDDVFLFDGLPDTTMAVLRELKPLGRRLFVRLASDRNGGLGEPASRVSELDILSRRDLAVVLEGVTGVLVGNASERDALASIFGGHIHVLADWVDLNVFRAGRTTRKDLEAFLHRNGLTGRSLVFVAGESVTPEVAENLRALSRELLLRLPKATILIASNGRFMDSIDGDFAESPGLAFLENLDRRDLFAALEAAEVFFVPEGQALSTCWIFEAAAMGLALLGGPSLTESAAGVFVPDETGRLLPMYRPGEIASAIEALLADGPRLEQLQATALAAARGHSVPRAVQRLLELVASGAGSSGEMLGLRDDDVFSRDKTKKEQVNMERDDLRDEGPGEEGLPPEATSKDDLNRDASSEGPEELVWDEREAGDDAIRFDPDSEAGFEALDEEVVEEPVQVPAREDRPERGREARPDRIDRGDRPDRGEVRDRPQRIDSRDRGGKRPGNSERDPRRRGSRGRSPQDVEELGASSGIDVLDIPSDRRPRRVGALEPGLTLKDLMPFLRPPRTVLVLGATTGNGHNRAASALVEAFKSLDRNLIVREADVVELVDKAFRPTFVRALVEDLAKSPAHFGPVFETVDLATEPPLPTEIDEVLDRGFAERFDQIVVDRRPDHIVCTHWLPFRRLEALKAEGRLTATVTAVIPDVEFSDRWKSSVVEQYLVASESVRARVVKAGIEIANVSIVGVPVSPAFSVPTDRILAAREMGLRPQIPTVLFRPGGIGATERILAATTAILDAISPVNLLIVAGKNERLREDLTKLEPVKGSVIKPFGFVDNIRDLMGSADILVSRPSPHTVAEAMAAGLPMVILRPSPGLEDRVADRILATGAALKVYGEADLIQTLTELFANRRLLQGLLEAASRHRHPEAASNAVDRIARIVR